MRLLRSLLVVLMVCGAGISARAFSLIGPFDSWQISSVGFNLTGYAELGGPQVLGEEYRWNIPQITYAFDDSFLNFFGQRGVQEVEKALKIINDLPAASQINPNNYPTYAQQKNYRAEALLLLDLKSETLKLLLEQLGLADPTRFAYSMRGRVPVNPQTTPPTFTYYLVLRNFEPITWVPTPYINGVLYTYSIAENTPVNGQTTVFNLPVDPLTFSEPTAALYGGFSVGNFYTGLTRDDVGALKYLYAPGNANVETPPASSQVVVPANQVTLTNTISGGSPFTPFVPPAAGTNATTTATNSGALFATNANANAIRPGVDKIKFIRTNFDSLLGQFFSSSSTYVETIIANGRAQKQTVIRTLTAPDIVFTAGDIDAAPPTYGGLMVSRSLGLQNNSALNGFPGNSGNRNGPGVINPTTLVTFARNGQIFSPASVTGAGALQQDPDLVRGGWASFDGTTNAPFVYPVNTSIQQIEQQVLSGF